MFLRRCFLSRTQFYRKYLQNDISSYTIRRNFQQISNYNGIELIYSRLWLHQNENVLRNKHSSYIFLLSRRWYSKGLLDGDISSLESSQREKELLKIKKLFPLPRVTLNELASKTPDRIFEIHYKQNTITPKSVRKKMIQGDWTCTYAFIWPEKMKFESTAISKRQAAEKAATNALHWLYINRRIDNKGSPIYNKNVLDELQSTLNEPIRIKISEKSVERIDKIWSEYESGIKDIYEETIREAMKKTLQMPVCLTRDSTIDEEDKFPEEESEMEDDVSDISEIKTHIHPVYGKSIVAPSASTLDRRDRVLRQKFEQYDEGLLPLPIDNYVEQITSTLEDSRVIIIVGAAGCGKSTRAPAAILRKCGAKTAAIVSEPRRVAAIGLAERVASELGEEVGDSVGYQIRLQARPPRPPAGSILYCTSGVLLRRMQLNPGLEGCTHVIIDEAHERDVNTDITLLLLKRALVMNPKLKVIIMSATLDIEVFTRYFDTCPIVEVPGRVFPVEVSYLNDIQNKFNIKLPNTTDNCNKEDSKPHINCIEVAEVIKAVDRTEPEGAILVFLPGWAEIKLTKQLLEESYGGSSMHMVLPVHSRLSTNDQTKMFTKPMLGVRKIVLATNIAETSITIPDVVYVVDTGAHKENRIKEGTGTASLETVWVSQAGAKQRTGRAGRVQPGHCYRLYTKEKEAEFAPHTTPEILRIPLVQTVLDCKSYAPDDKIENFLSQLPEPPSKKAIQFALKDLMDLGALSPTERLTRLGQLLSTMTLHPRVGCSVLHAAVVGDVLAAANVATHCSDNVELFQNPAERKDEIREAKSKYSRTSDHTALHWIQDEYEQILSTSGWRGVDEWCDRLGLRKERLKYVKSLSNLYLEQLLKSGIVEPAPDAEDLNRFSGIDEMTTGVLLSGTNSLLTTRRRVNTKGKLKTVVNLYTSTGDRAHVSTESVNYATAKTGNRNNLLAYFGGYHSTERRALVVYKTSLITPHAALLFCKGDVNKKVVSDNGVETTIISVPKHKLDMHLANSQADHILKVREMLWNTFQYYIERDTTNLDYDVHTTISRFKIRLMKTIGRILVEADKEYIQGKSFFDDEEETE